MTKTAQELETENQQLKEELDVWQHVVSRLIDKYEGIAITEEFLQSVTADVCRELNYKSGEPGETDD